MTIAEVCSEEDLHKRITIGVYDICRLEDDYTLSFYSEQGRSGGCFLSKDWYKSYGKTYGEAVVNYINHLQKSNKEYWKKIMQMLNEYSKGYMPLYFNEKVKNEENEKQKIDFSKLDDYKNKYEKAQDKINFAIQVIERLSFEIPDLHWKESINRAIEELKK